MIGMGADCIEHVFDSQPGFTGAIDRRGGQMKPG
jgi:hypothetical protein